MGNLFAQSKLFRPVPNTADTEVWDGSKWAYQSNPVVMWEDDVRDSLLYSRYTQLGGSGAVVVSTSAGTITLTTGTTALSTAGVYSSLPIYCLLHKKTTITCGFYYDADSLGDCIFAIGVYAASGYATRLELNMSNIHFYTVGASGTQATNNITCSEAAWHTLKMVIKGFPRDSAPASLCFIDGVLVADHDQPHAGVSTSPFTFRAILLNTLINEEHTLVVSDIQVIQEDL